MINTNETARLLIEALPYIRRFTGKVLVFPGAKGSSGWSGFFQSTRLMGTAPAAFVFDVVTTKAVLGAIVLTGFFGGAICTHVYLADDQWPFAAVFGVLTWLGIYLRDPRLRQLIPFRQLRPA